MSALVIYFGVEPPDPAWARALRDCDVVLEPYHPLVQERRFPEAFPHCRRWVYVNPTTIDPWILERTPTPPPITGLDDRWQLPRLDLTRPEALDWAVDTAVRIAADQGADIDGLFVDDLDRLLPDDAETAMDYLVRIATGLRREPGWFLNRAFELWPRVEGLDAVLLEDITPDLAGHEPTSRVRWMRDVVLRRIREAKRRGVRVHSLGYLDQEHIRSLRARDESLERELGALVDSVTLGADRALHEWRTSR